MKKHGIEPRKSMSGKMCSEEVVMLIRPIASGRCFKHRPKEKEPKVTATGRPLLATGKKQCKPCTAKS